MLSLRLPPSLALRFPPAQNPEAEFWHSRPFLNTWPPRPILCPARPLKDILVQETEFLGDTDKPPGSDDQVTQQRQALGSEHMTHVGSESIPSRASLRGLLTDPPELARKRVSRCGRPTVPANSDRVRCPPAQEIHVGTGTGTS